MGFVARVTLGAGTSEPRLEQFHGWGGQEEAAGLEGQLPVQWACQGEKGGACNKPQNPDPHLPVHIDSGGRVSVPPPHWAMWVINNSVLPDLPIHILITLWFLVTLSIQSPFHL